MDTQALARRIVELAEDKQATDIVLLDLRSMRTFADYFIICTGESDRQLKAVLDSIEEGVAKEFGYESIPEGKGEAGWVLLDYVDIVVHIFSKDMREFYKLENLWNEAAPLIVVQ